MSLDYDKAWFPRKSSGRGWALHGSWQGWVLMLSGFFLAIAGPSFFISTDAYALFLAVLFAAAYGLLRWKGEKSKWRGDTLGKKEPNQPPVPTAPSGRGSS